MRSPDDPDAAVARAIAGVYGPSGFHGSAVAVYEPAYGAFLITCAHVVNCALGRAMDATERPEDTSGLRFEFQAAADASRHVVDEVDLVIWRPKGAELVGGAMWEGDLAILRVVGERPPGIGMVPLGEHRVGGEVRSWFGSGVAVTIVSAKIDAYTAPWLTLNTTDSSLQFENGYSGGALWDRERKAVVGVVVSKMDGRGRAYAIPSAAFRSAIREREALAEGPYAEWREQAREHFAGWAALDAGAEAEETVVGLVGRLAGFCSQAAAEAADDPWRAPRLAVRMGFQLGMLIERALDQPDARPSLRDAEKVLLVLAPYLHAAGWEAVLRAAAATGRAADLERFRGQFPTLKEKQTSATLRGNHKVARAVERWLWRKWAVSSPGRNDAVMSLLDLAMRNGTGSCFSSGAGDAFAGLEPPARRVLRAALTEKIVAALFTAMVAPPSSAAAAGPVAAGLAGPVLRFDLVSRLVTVAQLMAVDPMQVAGVCEQLTVNGSYGVEELRDLVPEWSALGAGGEDGSVAACTLDVECQNVETEALLRAHCVTLDDFVMQILHRDATLRGIVPVRFASVKLRAALKPDGEPRYLFSDTRFTLDDDLIRELLMGDKLYGEPSLAYRELFQNALDACRYRDKQSEYLEKTKEDDTARLDWRGLIAFRHGYDGDREFVECRDTGVGMGREEIQNLFARGGARFVTSLRYLKERAEWEEAGVEFHPNSRFGIGVFSYFMIADEIQVKTYRHRPDGVAEYLQVDIAGPAAPLRITPLVGHGPSALGGTIVRLYLKPGLKIKPFTETLRRLVWYCDYEVYAKHGDDVFKLEPKVLSEYAAIGGGGGIDERQARNPRVRIDAGAETGVWWCTGQGAALNDGVVMGHDVYGAVVNLTGASSPKLTVDRNRPQNPEEVDAEVNRILMRNLAPLLDESGTVLSSDWLASFPDRRLGFADDVLRASVAAGNTRWSIGGNSDAATIGCLRQEVLPGSSTKKKEIAIDLARFWQRLPPPVAHWRTRVWTRAPGFGFPALRWLDPDSLMPLALPSDALLLYVGSAVLPGSLQVPLGHVLHVSWTLGCPPAHVVERLRDLGLDVPDVPEGITDDGDPFDRDLDLLLLSRNGDGKGPWIAEGGIDLFRIAVIATHADLELEQVAERYLELGYSVCAVLPERSALPSDWRRWVACAERARDQNDLDNNLAAGGCLEPYELVSAANILDIGSVQLWGALRTLGFSLPTPGGVAHPGDIDVANPMEKYCDWCGMWLPDGPPPFVHRFHERAEAPDWMRPFAGRLPEPGGPPLTMLKLGSDACSLNIEELDELKALGFDVSLLGTGYSGADRTVLVELEPLGDSVELLVAHVVVSALIYNKPVAQTLQRLAMFGLTPPAMPSVEVDGDDDRILTDYHGSGPRRYVDPARPLKREQVLTAAARTMRTIPEVVDRCRTLGFDVEEFGVDMEKTEPGDGILLSRDADALGPWLEMGPVSVAQLLFLALQTRRSISDIAARLKFYGYELPDDIDFTDEA